MRMAVAIVSGFSIVMAEHERRGSFGLEADHARRTGAIHSGVDDTLGSPSSRR